MIVPCGDEHFFRNLPRTVCIFAYDNIPLRARWVCGICASNFPTVGVLMVFCRLHRKSLLSAFVARSALSPVFWLVLFAVCNM